MPIEQCFPKIKSYLRAHDPIIPVLAEPEIEELILSAFTSVTTDDCCGWMEDCGYKNEMYKMCSIVSVLYCFPVSSSERSEELVHGEDYHQHKFNGDFHTGYESWLFIHTHRGQL